MSRYVQNYAPAQKYARTLCHGTKEPAKKYRIITDFANRMLIYDYVKATKVAKQKGVYPDPASCWTTHRGICQDISSLVVIMLRAVGIKSYLCIGHAGSTYHAWVQAYIGGKVYRYDHSNQAGKAVKYTVERVIK